MGRFSRGLDELVVVWSSLGIKIIRTPGFYIFIFLLAYGVAGVSAPVMHVLSRGTRAVGARSVSDCASECRAQAQALPPPSACVCS
eukprot:671238-Rhodomonas_salina.2